jgi:hypothetical protein
VLKMVGLWSPIDVNRCWTDVLGLQSSPKDQAATEMDFHEVNSKPETPE